MYSPIHYTFFKRIFLLNPAECDSIVNASPYKKMPNSFLKTFGKSTKNKEAVKYVFERFENVPWKLEDYS